MGSHEWSKPVNIYVASSWRNLYQPAVVKALRLDGHTVYDFKDEEGFNWREVDPAWQSWTPQQYLEGLKHHYAQRGYFRDMMALKECDAVVYVMPCGVSASLEAGWACGTGKRVFVYVPEIREPDLMVQMAELVTDDLWLIVTTLRGL